MGLGLLIWAGRTALPRRQLTEDEAFQHLVANARDGGRDLHASAAQVIATATRYV
jgi:AmiR/NasT family two-component response regulator